jgi:predicted unusual protein kinase regulating ubiquinone biosynthesis (AarF/ABC1/UbiB family)
VNECQPLHEGNFMLGDDGKLVMLDFGLVTTMVRWCRLTLSNPS